MKLANHSVSMRLTCPWVALLLIVTAGSAAQARIHSLSGNARYQIGSGLPVPVGTTVAPDGKVLAVPGALIRQHGVHAPSQPAKVVIEPTQLSHPGTPPVNLPIFVSAGIVFQLHTAISLRFPRSQISFRAGGRTGPSIVTFCGQPGSATVARAGGNPACAGGTAGTGLLRYTRTSNQFGGPARGAVGGAANQALRGGSSAPCTGPPACIVAFAKVTPVSLSALGGAFGASVTTSAPAPSPGAFFGTVGPAGSVLALGTPLGAGQTNAGTGWGGPWTTGMLTASQPSAVPPQKFTITGADGRAAGSGAGSLSLVAGGFSTRMLSGPNAKRGWLNLTVGAQVSHVPTLPLHGLASLAALTVLSGAYALRRRRSP